MSPLIQEAIRLVSPPGQQLLLIEDGGMEGWRERKREVRTDADNSLQSVTALITVSTSNAQRQSEEEEEKGRGGEGERRRRREGGKRGEPFLCIFFFLTGSTPLIPSSPLVHFSMNLKLCLSPSPPSSSSSRLLLLPSSSPSSSSSLSSPPSVHSS
ncbi:unnamed protein product [Pleuronectes platessa]|uniref:Uncharacterized protein n=1 Tax=Pleuronectes platessa TaxID=8262 RepID=A0A9N7UUY4_PLEPL|nr:unnamed protein product [Pleuronectes platessa]